MQTKILTVSLTYYITHFYYNVINRLISYWPNYKSEVCRIGPRPKFNTAELGHVTRPIRNYLITYEPIDTDGSEFCGTVELCLNKENVNPEQWVFQ